MIINGVRVVSDAEYLAVQKAQNAVWRGIRKGNPTKGDARRGYRGGRQPRYPSGTPSKVVALRLPWQLCMVADYLGEGNRSRGVQRALEYFARPGTFGQFDPAAENAYEKLHSLLKHFRAGVRDDLQTALKAKLEPPLPAKIRGLLETLEAIKAQDARMASESREPWDDLPSPIDVDQPMNQE